MKNSKRGRVKRLLEEELQGDIEGVEDARKWRTEQEGDLILTIDI